ncbi:unnamed protein product [Rotaria socialis]|uniref:dihydropyrimidinase n=1 Tax=Rotaria socialis TaxID=392032 RepID=A0A820MKF6_9BILA|nr:unnamed protein product [Rotaria socialis]CAF4373992.1 unnamed protein product [Rotaria socialis]
MWNLFYIFVFIITNGSGAFQDNSPYKQPNGPSTRSQSPPPFNESYQFVVLTGGKVYGLSTNSNSETEYTCTPERKDVVIASGKILSIMDPSQTTAFVNSIRESKLTILPISVQDHIVIPGLVDVHVHAIGGGGEQGPYSRTPESRLSQLINGGLTTIVGILGTDGVTRSLSSLLQKMKSLQHDGLTTWMWTGSYRIPIVTLTGSLQQDVLLIDKIIGAGELALSDHRSSWPSKDELKQLLSDVRVAGMLSGKAGVIHFHMGSAPTKIDLLWQILNETAIPIQHMYLTHMSSRGDALIEEAKKWIQAGGMCDFTADAEVLNETATIETLNKFRAEKLPLKQITVSSDAYGSFPEYDSSGRLVSYSMGLPDLTLKTIQNLVLKYSWPIAEAIQFSTSNPATYLNLKGKGFLGEGYDADVLVLNETDLTPLYVIGRGQILKTPTWVKHDMFEQFSG